jgi:hypothetical protein
MVIVALDHVVQCYTAEDGLVIRELLAEGLRTGLKVTLSLAGVGDVTSSFVNSAVVALAPEFPLSFVKSRLAVSHASKQAADMVRRCVDNAEKMSHAA